MNERPELSMRAPAIRTVGPLTLYQCLSEELKKLDIVGDSPEVAADRLLQTNDLLGALRQYAACGNSHRRVREKMALVSLDLQRDEDALQLLRDREGASDTGLQLELMMLMRNLGGFDSEHLRLRLDEFALALLAHDDQEVQHDFVPPLCYTFLLNARSIIGPNWHGLTIGGRQAFEQLEKTGSEWLPALKILRLWRNCMIDSTEKPALLKYLTTLDLDSIVGLSIAFHAASYLERFDLCHAVIRTLCTREAPSKALAASVAVAAQAIDQLALLDYLPPQARAFCETFVEVRMLQALANREAGALNEATTTYLAANAVGITHLDTLALDLFWLTEPESRWGDWQHPTGLIETRIGQFLRLLPPGPTRDKCLLKALSCCSEEDVQLTRELAMEYFERQPCDSSWGLIRDLKVVHQIKPESLASYLIGKAITSPQSPAVASGKDLNESQELQTAILSQLAPYKAIHREHIERTLIAWKVLPPTQRQRREQQSAAILDLLARLRGETLPETIRMSLTTLRASVAHLTGHQAVYLHSALSRLVDETKGVTLPAAAASAVVGSINDILLGYDRQLNETGISRIEILVKRYGAAAVLEAFYVIAREHSFDPDSDIVSPLSAELVRRQGGLISRRAYLASILRKRLVNLKSTWLDQQVSECLRNGVDIEQMIELSKSVATWDDWNGGLVKLRPY